MAVGFVAVSLAASLSGNVGGAVVLGTLAFAGFFLAALLASGYQALRRRATRPEGAYRGPSPLLVFGAVFAAANVVTVLLRATGWLERVSQGGTVLVSVAIIAALYGATVWFLVVREDALSWMAMGWPTARSRAPQVLADVAYGIGLAVPTVLLTIIVAALLGAWLHVSEPSLLPIPLTPADWIVDLLVAVVIAPVGEELFFRGFAQTAWTLDMGPRAALIRTALFFAAVHALNVSGTDFSEAVRIAVVVALARLPVAVTLGWVFTGTRSIAAPLGLHAAFNGVTLVLFAFLQSGASPG